MIRPAIYLLPGLGDDHARQLSAVAAVLGENGDLTILPALPSLDQSVSTCIDFGCCVDQLARLVTGADVQHPTILIGYSVGGTFAIALADHLVSAGRPIANVVLIDSSAVYPPAVIPFVRSIRDRFAVSVLHGLMMAPFLTFTHLNHLRMARMVLGSIGLLQKGVTYRDMRMLLLIRYWRRAISGATLPTYAGRVTLLKARRCRPRITEPNLGWTLLVPDLTVIDVDADHWSIVKSPALPRLLTNEVTGCVPTVDQYVIDHHRDPDHHPTRQVPVLPITGTANSTG